jgi:hypothetical protein
MGGEQDILVAGRGAVKQEVMKLLRAYGSAGKAEEVGNTGQALRR